MSFSAEIFKQMMRQYPAAVNLITTGHAPHRSGLTATAVMSLSVEPVRMVCAVNQNASTYQQILSNRAFAINTLAQQQIELAQDFSGQTELKGEARFAENEWHTLKTGAPILRQAMLSFDCELQQAIDMGSHALLIGTVVAAQRQPALPPLLYVDGQWLSVNTN